MGDYLFCLQHIADVAAQCVVGAWHVLLYVLAGAVYVLFAASVLWVPILLAIGNIAIRHRRGRRSLFAAIPLSLTVYYLLLGAICCYRNALGLWVWRVGQPVDAVWMGGLAIISFIALVILANGKADRA